MALVYESFDASERELYSEQDMQLYNDIELELSSSSGYYAGGYGGAYLDVEDDAVAVYESIYGRAGVKNPTTTTTPTPAKKSQATLQRESDILARFYWNEKLQMLLERPVFTYLERKSRQEDIADLLQRFEHVAAPVVETIVRELSLPVEKKTIKPVNVGGIAGGNKYVHRNLFIKLCADDTTTKLYGNMHFGQKAASHELKSLNALIAANVSNLYFPLISLAICRGFRLMVISKLPISPATLVYGSADAGKSIYTDSSFGALLKKAAKRLNLKPHYALDQDGIPKLVYGPVDLEGHRGADLRYYCCDAARLFPPTLPMRGVPGCHLYKLFRKEYLAKHCPDPLSSDAFSAFGRHEAALHNKEAKDATTKLLKTVIPALAMTIDVQDRNIKDALHEQGVNLRYLGMLLREIDPDKRQFLLVEMASRVLKNELFNVQREAGHNAEQACVDYLNKMLFGTQPFESSWQSDATALFATYFEFCRAPSFNDDSIVADALHPHLEKTLNSPTLRSEIFVRCLEYAGIELNGAVPDSVDMNAPLTCSLRLITRFKRMEFHTILEDQRSFEELESLYLQQIAESGETDLLLPHLNLSLLYSFNGLYAKARKQFIRAKELAEDKTSLVLCEVMERGVSCLFVAASALALTWSEKVVEIKRSLGVELELAQSLEMWAVVALFVGNGERAEELCIEAAELKRRSGGDDVDMLKNNLLRARIWTLAKNEFEKAHQVLTSVEKSMTSMATRTKDLVVHVLDMRALCEMRRGRFVEARELFLQAIEKHLEVGTMHLPLAHCYDHLAICLSQMGDVTEADSYFSKALVVCASLGDRASYSNAVILFNRSIVQGSSAETRDALATALALLPPDEIRVRNRIAQMLARRDFSAEYEYHVEALGAMGASNKASLAFSVDTLSKDMLELLYSAGVTKEMLADPEELETIFTFLLESLSETAATDKETEDAQADDQAGDQDSVDDTFVEAGYAGDAVSPVYDEMPMQTQEDAYSSIMTPVVVQKEEIRDQLKIVAEEEEGDEEEADDHLEVDLTELEVKTASMDISAPEVPVELSGPAAAPESKSKSKRSFLGGLFGSLGRKKSSKAEESDDLSAEERLAAASDDDDDDDLFSEETATVPTAKPAAPKKDASTGKIKEQKRRGERKKQDAAGRSKSSVRPSSPSSLSAYAGAASQESPAAMPPPPPGRASAAPSVPMGGRGTRPSPLSAAGGGPPPPGAAPRPPSAAAAPRPPGAPLRGQAAAPQQELMSSRKSLSKKKKASSSASPSLQFNVPARSKISSIVAQDSSFGKKKKNIRSKRKESMDEQSISGGGGGSAGGGGGGGGGGIGVAPQRAPQTSVKSTLSGMDADARARAARALREKLAARKK